MEKEPDNVDRDQVVLGVLKKAKGTGHFSFVKESSVLERGRTSSHLR